MTVLSGGFPPAYLGGGPARSIAGLVEALEDEVEFSIIASGIELDGVTPVQGIEPDRWIDCVGGRVWFTSDPRPGLRLLLRLLRDSRPDAVYLNSLFAYRFSVLPLLLLRVWGRRVPVLLTPRGELASGALSIRAPKKRLFLRCFRALRFHRKVTWHAASPGERADIERAFGGAVQMHVATCLRSDLVPPELEPAAVGRPEGGLPQLVFLSRLVPVKNLAGLLDALRHVDRPIHLTIAGPPEDDEYVSHCRRLAASLPTETIVTWVGPVPADEVVATLRKFDLFVLPTFGESFGHVILEALVAGVPVILGQDTPWGRVVDDGAGWTVDPHDPHELAARIVEFLELDLPARQRMSRAASEIARQVHSDDAAVEANRQMFRALLRGREELSIG